MKLIIVALALVAFVAANPVPEGVLQAVEEILRSSFNKEADGAYQFGFETAKGINREETGELKNVIDDENNSHQVVVMRGTYSYVKPDGTLELVSYVADENGFRAEGDSIPKQP